MYQSTSEFGELVQQRSRTFKAKLVVDGSTEITEGIKSIVLTGGSNGKDTFVIGSAVSQYISVTLNRPMVSLENHEIEYCVGLEVSGSTEWIPCGFYTVGKLKTDESETSFTAYDRMLKTERAYFSDLPEETDTISILSEIASFLEIQIPTLGLPSIKMKRPDGYTCREVLGYVAQMYGGFAVCNRSGQIEILEYIDNEYRVESCRYWDSFQHNDFPYTLEKITCYTGKDSNGNDISISAGSGAREMAVSNPFMVQADLDRIWLALNRYTFMPGSLKFLGDPRIDPWDILTVIGTDGAAYKVPAMKLVQDFDGGLTTEVEAVGWTESETEDGFSGPLTQMYERYAAQLALINHAIVNKLDADVAKITYALITDLEATNAKIENLDVIYAKIDELNAVNATIGTLNAAYANIANLLSGNAGIGDLVNIHLTTQNAVIDSALVKNLVSEHITVNDLKAGIIYTDKMQIWSDSAGGMKLIGPTLQWTDKNKIVRMQAGLDAQGSFDYYICDTTGAVMWNALGLTPDAIKSPIIVNDMVADDANISAGKLDIHSLETVLNAGDVHIQSSVVKLDTSGQTLDAALSQIHDEINGIVADDGTYILQTYVEGGHVGDTQTATIHAKVYVKNADVTETIPPERFLWSRYSEYADEDAIWNSQQITGYSLSLSGEDVSMLAEFQCLLTIPEEYSMETLSDYILTDLGGNELLALYI